MKKEKLELRKTIIKLHQKGKKQTEILTYWTSHKAQFLLDYPPLRTDNLKDKPRSGRPKWLNKKQTEEFKKVLLDFPPARFGGKSFGWTTKMAIQYVKDHFGIKYGMRQMQKLFHKFGLSLITPRTKHRKSSDAARIVYRMDFKKNSKKNIWIAPSLISTK